MTKEDLKKLYDDLEQEEKHLREQLSGIADPNPAVKNDYQVKMPNYGEDEDENAMESTDLDRNFAMERELESKLNEILKTKEKIKSGTYGKCENCSAQIPAARLKVRPVSALCVDCAEKIV
jgi:DnaK suppressor protein